MADATTTQATEDLSVDLQTIFAQEMAADLAESRRSHSRFMGVLDRVYLQQYTETQDPNPKILTDSKNAAAFPYAINPAKGP